MRFAAIRDRKGSANASGQPFPTQQLFILALCRICEPIAFMSIFPYIYYMIESFDITSDSYQIAIYAGMVTSSFAFAEFSTSVLWGRLSDRIGRKPVLLGGLAGTAVSMTIFGFSTNLPMALIGRALGGFLNGNIAVLQTTVAELVKAKKHQPRAYSIMPFVWCLGSILGPALGGALAQPAQSFPAIFVKGSMFESYPFLLANLVCVAILCFGLVIGTLFLEETHAERKHDRDLGLEMGRWILAHFSHRRVQETIEEKARVPEELEKLLVQELPCYQSSRSFSTRSSAPDHVDISSKPVGAPKAFTKAVIMNIVAYGIIAYHAISFDQMMPIFLSSPASIKITSLPFRFTGGFGLSSQAIGGMLSVQGVYSMFAQVFLFPFVVKRFGSLATFRAIVIVWPLLYVVVPYLIFLPHELQTAGIMVCLLWRITAQVLAFPSIAILLTNSAPSMMVLGLVNGVAASTASLSRAFGPTVSGTLFSWSSSIGFSGLAWWAAGIVSLLGALQSLWMEEVSGRMDMADDTQVEACVVESQ